jgi:TonB family protein
MRGGLPNTGGLVTWSNEPVRRDGNGDPANGIDRVVSDFLTELTALSAAVDAQPHPPVENCQTDLHQQAPESAGVDKPVASRGFSAAVPSALPAIRPRDLPEKSSDPVEPWPGDDEAWPPDAIPASASRRGYVVVCAAALAVLFIALWAMRHTRQSQVPRDVTETVTVTVPDGSEWPPSGDSASAALEVRPPGQPELPPSMDALGYSPTQRDPGSGLTRGGEVSPTGFGPAMSQPQGRQNADSNRQAHAPVQASAPHAAESDVPSQAPLETVSAPLAVPVSLPQAAPPEPPAATDVPRNQTGSIPAAGAPQPSTAQPTAEANRPADADAAPAARVSSTAAAEDRRESAALPATLPVPINRVMPVYPVIAKKNKIAGTVDVETTVGENGAVLSANALNGPFILRPAAEEAVRKWQFKPATHGGVNLRSTVRISISFNPN